jgi:hypothetical protein
MPPTKAKSKGISFASKPGRDTLSSPEVGLTASNRRARTRTIDALLSLLLVTPMMLVVL